MYYGKQVLRFATNYKSKDLYNIGNEMTKRKGTGNYDSDRTQFNTHYIDIESPNLYQEVKRKLEDRNIEYLHKTKTNMLNGVTITSGPEFFQTLGMKFKESDRTYKSGAKKGKPVLVPDIKSLDDIPTSTKIYFNNCMDYLKETFGEENIVMAQVHYDEDTPHLQAYFLPVVNEVKRKVFEKDSDGNVIKELVYSKDGNEKLVPKLKRDSEGKIVYENVKGKFLNNDQFWKDLGGKESFSRLQDSFNQFINSKGYKLDRGEIGSNKVHQDKLDFKISEFKAELNDLNTNITKYKNELNKAKETLKNSLNQSDINSLTPKKTLGKYISKDVDKLIDYSTKLNQLNKNQEYELNFKKKKINSLEKSINYYDKNNELKYKKENYKQKEELDLRNRYIDYLINSFFEVSKALDNILGKHTPKTMDSYVSLAKSINASHEVINKDKEAQDEFSKLFKDNDKEL